MAREIIECGHVPVQATVAFCVDQAVPDAREKSGVGRICSLLRLRRERAAGELVDGAFATSAQGWVPALREVD